MNTDPKIITALVNKVRTAMAEGRVDMDSSVDIIRTAVDVGASWNTVEDVIAVIAKGVDGVLGTPDDLIPPATLNMLLTLLHNGVVQDMVQWAADISTAKKRPIAWLRCCWGNP